MPVSRPVVSSESEINKRTLEPGLSLGKSLKDIPRYLNLNTVTAGLVAAIFSCTGPALIIINSAMQGNLNPEQLTSWMFGVYFFGGMISLFLSLRYRQPLAGAFSIPGAVMMGTALQQVSFSHALGAYIISGVILVLLGLSGLMSKVMRFLPQPIVMGMIAGTLVRFGTGIISSAYKAPVLGGVTLLGYFVTQRFWKRVPPIFGGLVAGVLSLLLLKGYSFQLEGSFIFPHVYQPSFAFTTFFSISLPMIVLILGSENAQTIGVTKAQGYQVPVNMITTVSGTGSLLAAFFGAHAANMAGVSTAICAAPDVGPKEGRYAATVVAGSVFMIFGMLSSLAAAFIKALPVDLINVVAGLSMLGVLTGAFEQSFKSGRFKSGALFSLLIAMSGINLFQISAPFWAIIGGLSVSILVEPEDVFTH